MDRKQRINLEWPRLHANFGAVLILLCICLWVKGTKRGAGDKGYNTFNRPPKIVTNLARVYCASIIFGIIGGRKNQGIFLNNYVDNSCKYLLQNDKLCLQ